MAIQGLGGLKMYSFIRGKGMFKLTQGLLTTKIPNHDPTACLETVSGWNHPNAAFKKKMVCGGWKSQGEWCCQKEMDDNLPRGVWRLMRVNNHLELCELSQESRH